MVGFFNGIAIGAGVVVAKYFGAKKFNLVQRAIHTIVALGIVSGILLTVVGVVAADVYKRQVYKYASQLISYCF